MDDLSNQIICQTKKSAFSDIHIHVGLPLALRIDGKIIRLQEEVVSTRALELFIRQHLDANQRHDLDKKKSLDANIQCGKTHFRTNLYHTCGKLAMVLRKIEEHIPSMRVLGIPQHIDTALNLGGGLVLVSGPTGAGKSTSLAAITQHLLEHQAIHLITIEDPIEYRFSAQGSIVSQRQVGHDTLSFDDALYAALREDPDVILLGEMRTPQTIELALIAAQLGHLVLATLHANTASDAVARIVHAFGVDANNAEHVRTQLADSLRLVISQRLVPKKGTAGRVALFEMMFATVAVQNSIRSNRIFHLPSIIETSQSDGMVTFHTFSEQLHKKGVIDCVVA